MGGPTLSRAALAAGTMGMSEVPRQFMAAGDVLAGAAKGDPAGGFKAAGDTYSGATDSPALGTPPADTSGQEAANADAKKSGQEEEARRLRSGGGRASTILTSTDTALGSRRRTLGSA